MFMKQNTPEELAREAEHRNGEFSLGEYVKTPGSKNNVAKIVKRETEYKVYYTVEFPNGITARLEGRDLEPAPKLTPEEAWLKLPGLIMAEIKGYTENNQLSFELRANTAPRALFEPDRRAIRHECYKFLGEAGIKVTDLIRENVANTVEEIAQLMGVRVY